MTGKFKDEIKTEIIADLAGELDDMKRIKEDVEDNLTPAVKGLQKELSNPQESTNNKVDKLIELTYRINDLKEGTDTNAYILNVILQSFF